MANASVDKLKALGLRHGEKLVMLVTAALSLFLLFTAATQETIQTTPEQVKQAAQAAQQNLSRDQPPEDILSRLEQEGVKNPGFETIVEQQQKNLLVAANYRPHQRWVTPEPGAGLIRDTPTLIAPTEILAYPGRGGILIYELDENGNRILDPDAGTVKDPEKEARRKKKKSLSASAARRKMGEARKKQEEEKERLAEAERKRLAVAGKVPAKAEAPAAAEAPAGPMKEVTRGVRWVALTGVLDYKTLRENYLNALKRPEVAYPHFKMLEVERQAKQTDGSWDEWTAIDLEQNRQILDNLPEEDEEWTPETVRLSALVAPLPFLKPGYGFWQGVHVGRFVPEEKLKVAAAPPSGGEGMDSAGPESAPLVESVQPDSAGSGSDPGMSVNVEGMYGSGPVEAMDFEKTEAPEVMVRALDFTVAQDTTYRFRVRLVVYNPNRGREDVSPGVDTKSIELFGPWSEPSDEVTMPSDVATYVMAREPSVPRRLDEVKFDVACWIPDDGVTVVRSFKATPGEVIGEVVHTPLPYPDSSGKKPAAKRVNFNSHRIVLDAMGGTSPVPPLGPGLGSQFYTPATSLVMRSDGSVIVHNQANDVNDRVRKDMDENYHRILKGLEKKKGTSAPGADEGAAAP